MSEAVGFVLIRSALKRVRVRKEVSLSLFFLRTHNHTFSKLPPAYFIKILRLNVLYQIALPATEHYTLFIPWGASLLMI